MIATVSINCAAGASFLPSLEFRKEFTTHGRRRTKISFFNLFSLGTDRNYNGGADFYIANSSGGRLPLTIDTTDTVTMAHGASVGGQFAHTGAQAGFFGATPTNRPVVNGKWSDGTAQRSLLAALVRLGLVTDQTEE